MLTATLEGPTPSDTVVRFLDENADIETDYGDNFVSSIDGVEGSTVDGGLEDWFFFVNGVYSEIGAGEVDVEPGDRIWWDHRAWSEAYRVPAVVGSLARALPARLSRRVRPARSSSASPSAPRLRARSRPRSREAGVEPTVEDGRARRRRTPTTLRVLVGPWEALRSDPAARADRGAAPAMSGVYADVDECCAGRLGARDARLRRRAAATRSPTAASSPPSAAARTRRRSSSPAATEADVADAAAALLDEETLARPLRRRGRARRRRADPDPAPDDEAPTPRRRCE